MNQIRARAYELYEAGGCEDVLTECYWRQAECVAPPIASTGDRLPSGPRKEVALSPGEQRVMILVRHSRRIRTVAQSESEHRMDGWPRDQRPVAQVNEDDGKSTRKSGWKKTVDVAVALAEQLAVERTYVTHILHSPHEVAAQTARVYAAVLCRNGPAVVSSLDWLEPAAFRTLASKQIDENLTDLWRLSCPQEYFSGHTGASSALRRAVILVGHQPQLSEIADVLLRGSRNASVKRMFKGPMPVPLGGSEAACVWLDPGCLRWLLTEKGGSIAADLKDKLRSKVDIAKFFLGALAVNAGVLTNANLWNSARSDQVTALALSALSIFAGLALAVATLLSYDLLNMPPDFWGEGARFKARQDRANTSQPRHRSVLRPPSEASVVLFYEMVNVWRSFFVPALLFSIGGLSGILMSLVVPRLEGLLQLGAKGRRVEVWLVTALLALTTFGITLWYRGRRPELGTED